jgi:hypothetical protein
MKVRKNLKIARIVLLKIENQIRSFLSQDGFRLYLGVLIAGVVSGAGVLFLVSLAFADAVPNQVLSPDYENNSQGGSDQDTSSSSDQIQYDPSDSEQPIIKSKNVVEEISHGAQYPPGIEAVIDPGSSFTVKDEPITEQSPMPPPVLDHN